MAKYAITLYVDVSDESAIHNKKDISEWFGNYLDFINGEESYVDVVLNNVTSFEPKKKSK